MAWATSARAIEYPRPTAPSTAIRYRPVYGALVHRVGPLEGHGQPLRVEHVDALDTESVAGDRHPVRLAYQGDDLVSRGQRLLGDRRPDTARSADHCDLHGSSVVSECSLT